MKIEHNGKTYETVRIDIPKRGELYLSFTQRGGPNVFAAKCDFETAHAHIVREIPPAVPQLPPIPDGWRLLKDDEVMDGTELRCDGVDRRLDWLGRNEDVAGLTVRELSGKYPGLKILAVIRKVAVKKRPMNREEFLKAWEKRGWCPLITPHGDIVPVSRIVSNSLQIIGGPMFLFHPDSNGIEDLQFASDNSPCTVESVE